jgi:crotonobetainyl-CoA:carnitine CoA-transferase CaiB-like acyl-CoA transferase
MIEPILDLDEALESELVSEREMTVTYEQPLMGEIKQLGFPIKLSGTPASIERPAPALGEHTAQVLGTAGYSAEEIQALEESGAAKGPDGEAKHEQFLDARALRGGAEEQPV